VIDVVEDAEHYYFVMELIEGGNMLEFLQENDLNNDQLTVSQVAKLLR